MTVKKITMTVKQEQVEVLQVLNMKKIKIKTNLLEVHMVAVARKAGIFQFPITDI